MKKLNQKGWGLSVFLSFIVVFFIAIILISIGAQKAGIGTSPSISSSPIPTDGDYRHYTEAEITKAVGFESTVRDSAIRYLTEVYGGQWGEDRKVITVSKLIESGYLESLNVAGNNCSGYVKVDSVNGALSYVPYVHCGDVYKTNEYDYSLE